MVQEQEPAVQEQEPAVLVVLVVQEPVLVV